MWSAPSHSLIQRPAGAAQLSDICMLVRQVCAFLLHIAGSPEGLLGVPAGISYQWDDLASAWLSFQVSPGIAAKSFCR